jgi:hypothetical protein
LATSPQKLYVFVPITVPLYVAVTVVDNGAFVGLATAKPTPFAPA